MKHSYLFLDSQLLQRSGYLYGMKPEGQKILRNLILQITNEMLRENELAEDVCIPILRHIVTHITESNENHSPSIIHSYLTADYHKDSGITKEKLLAAINIEEFIGNLVPYCQHFMPMAEEYLPNLDGQAELTVLFSNNYMMKILNQVVCDEGNKYEIK